MAKITESELKKHIKNKTFSPVYLIYGSEQLFVKKYTQKLCEAATGKHPSDFCYHTFSGEVNLGELSQALQVLPLGGGQNCVVVTDIFLDSMTADELAAFKEITDRVYDGTVFIISMPSYVPSKNKVAFTALAKRVEKHGSVCCFEKIGEATVEKFIVKWVGENGKFISHINASRLINNVGEDLNTLKNEVDKLCFYAHGEEISGDDIDLLSVVNLEARTFDMADDVINGRGERAFGKLNILFDQREEPVNILYALSSAYIDAYRIRVADECALSKEVLAKDFEYKNRAFVLSRARSASRRISTESLRLSLEALVDTDKKLKSSSLNSRFVIEQLISRLLLIAKEGAA